MSMTNIIDARPNAPIVTTTIEAILSQPDPLTERLSEIETKLAEIEARLRELQKFAAAADKIYALEARIKGLEAIIVALTSQTNHKTAAPQTNETKIAEQTAEPQTTEKKEDQPTNSGNFDRVEVMVLRVLYKKLEYWIGRPNLKVDENGFAVIGRDMNFGVKYSEFVRIMAKYGLSDLVFARGNDRAGYYVEVKASEMSAALQRLKTLDDQFKGALSRPIF